MSEKKKSSMEFPELTISVELKSTTEGAVDVIRAAKPLIDQFSGWLDGNQQIRLAPVEKHLMTTFILWLYHNASGHAG